MPNKADRLNIRIDDRLKRRMKRQAKKEQRSVSNMILKVMRDYLDEKEKNSMRCTFLDHTMLTGVC